MKSIIAHCEIYIHCADDKNKTPPISAQVSSSAAEKIFGQTCPKLDAYPSGKDIES